MDTELLRSDLKTERACHPNPIFWRTLTKEEKLLLKQMPKQRIKANPLKFKIPITSKKPLLSNRHRPLLVDYIFDTVGNHFCSKSAAFMAVQFLDRCIENDGYYAFVIKGGSVKPQLNESTCQMVALACAFISMKMENSSLYFEIADLRWDEAVCAETFESNLFRTEKNVLNCLEWKLQTPNCGSWLGLVEPSKKLIGQAEVLCEALVKEPESMEFLSSYLVASVLLFLGHYESMYGYSRTQLEKGIVLVSKTVEEMKLS